MVLNVCRPKSLARSAQTLATPTRSYFSTVRTRRPDGIGILPVWLRKTPQTVIARTGQRYARAASSSVLRLDANQGQLKNETFVLVGYGVDIGAKKQQIVVPERRMTTSFLKAVQTEVVAFQTSVNDSKAGGGSCFGDSGGPTFLGDYVIGDASYVNSLTCNATGTYQRVDTAYARAFLDQFIP